MTSQMKCLNASITQSKLPIMIQITSDQYEMRRVDLKNFATLSRANAEYNYTPQLTNTIIAKQKCDDQIWMTG